MLRYSIALLAVVAIFNGCDSDCCTEKKEVISTNVAPVARINNSVNGSVVECIPNTSVNLTNDSTDTNNNLDSTKVTWETADGNPTTQCPADDATAQVCLMVEDQEGLTNRACITLKGKAAVTTCPTPVITATDPLDNNNTVTTLTKGNKYYFGYQQALDSCPNMTCNWTVRSKNGNQVNVEDCFSFEAGGTDHGEQSGTYSGTWVKLCDAQNVFDTIEVNLTCTGKDTVSTLYTAQ